MLADPEVAEEAVEVGSLLHVVVADEHVHHERLAEAAGTDEEEVVVGGFNLGNEVGLIDVIAVLEADGLPVLFPVGDAFGLVGVRVHDELWLFACKYTE